MGDVVLQKKTLRKMGSRSNELAGSKPSTFATGFLEKLGWKDGDGLGKNRQGRSSHVRVTMKDDTLGVGARKAGTEAAFSNTWWQSGLDSALSNFKAPSFGSDGDGDDDDDDDDDDEEDDEANVEDKKHGEAQKAAAAAQDQGRGELGEESRISIELRDLSQYTEADRKLFIACEGRRCGKRAGRLQVGKIRREHLADAKFKEHLESVAEKDQQRDFHKVASASTLPTAAAGGEGEEKRRLKAEKRERKRLRKERREVKERRRKRKREEQEQGGATEEAPTEESPAEEEKAAERQERKKRKKDKKRKAKGRVE